MVSQKEKERYMAMIGQGGKRILHMEWWSNPDAETYLTGIDHYDRPRDCRLRLAELYPELISVLFLDAPVTNLLSLAGLGECTNKAVPIFWKEMVDTFGFTQSTILTYRKSPIDNMKPLIENNIPIIMVYGDADDVVLYRENGQILEDYYKEHNGDISIIRVPGRGHHPHGLADPTPIIEYVEAHL